MLGRRGVRRRRTSRLATALVVLATAAWSIPTLGLAVTSFRTNEAQAYAGWWRVVVDHQVSLDSYTEVLTGGDLLPTGIWPYLVNSLVIVLPVMAVGLTIAAMAAYGLAWLRVPVSGLLIGIVVGLQVVPVQMTLLPLLKLFSVGWSIGPIPVVPALTNAAGKPLFAGTYVPLWFTHAVLLLPLAVLLLHRAMVEVPRALVQVAQRAHRVVVLTGAGMSAESGLATFRDPENGLWQRFAPQHLASAEGWEDDPELVWAWYLWRFERAHDVRPNAGHVAIAQWGERVDLLLPYQVNSALLSRAARQGAQFYPAPERCRFRCLSDQPWNSLHLARNASCWSRTNCMARRRSLAFMFSARTRAGSPSGPIRLILA